MLFEIMIVIAIIALISGGVALAVYKYYEQARNKSARTGAETIRAGVKASWIDASTDACPSVEQLIESEHLDDGSPRRDPWGGPWRIACDGTRVSVKSDGPDRQPGTPDDIQVPKP